MHVTLALRRWKQENQELRAELEEALAITRQPEFHLRNTRGGRKVRNDLCKLSSDLRTHSVMREGIPIPTPRGTE